jgi:hypothetical protein
MSSWGSPQFIGLGFLSFMSILFTELFGSPFMKNISIIIGLVVGCIVAGATGYIDGSSIKSAPAVTFLWLVPASFTVRPTLMIAKGCIRSRFVSTHRPFCPCSPCTVRQPVLSHQFWSDLVFQFHLRWKVR